GTVLKDDPKLTVKAEYVKGRNPLRIVLDSRGRTPAGANVLDRSAPTLIVTSEASKRTFSEVEVLRIGKDEVDLESLLDRLAARGIRLLLVEGGSTVIGSFLRRGLADELKVFVASEVLGGLSAPTLVGSRDATPAEDAVRLRLDRAAAPPTRRSSLPLLALQRGPRLRSARGREGARPGGSPGPASHLLALSLLWPRVLARESLGQDDRAAARSRSPASPVVGTAAEY